MYDVRLRLVVAAKVVKINEPESSLTREVLRQGLTNLGPDAIRVLLSDRGFLDGLTLWHIQHTDGVDFVIPAKDGMRVNTDARAFLNQKPDGQWLVAAERPGQGPHQAGHVKLIGVTGLTSYDQYGDEAHQRQVNRSDFEGQPLNALVVTEFDHHVYTVDPSKVFLTSLPVTDALAVLERTCSSCWAARPISVGVSIRTRSIASMPPMACGGPSNGAISVVSDFT